MQTHDAPPPGLIPRERRRDLSPAPGAREARAAESLSSALLWIDVDVHHIGGQGRRDRILLVATPLDDVKRQVRCQSTATEGARHDERSTGQANEDGNRVRMRC